MTTEEEAEFVEGAARAMCLADGLDPDEHGPAIPSRALTVGEAMAGQILPLAMPNWHNYRRNAIMLVAATNEMWAVAGRIIERQSAEKVMDDPE